MKNVISRRSFLKAAGIIGASAALAACGGSSASTAGSTAGSIAGAAASGESVTFTLSMVDNEQSNYYKGAQAIADSVNEATNGQFQIKVALWAASLILWTWPFRATWTSQAAQTPCWQTTSPR